MGTGGSRRPGPGVARRVRSLAGLLTVGLSVRRRCRDAAAARRVDHGLAVSSRPGRRSVHVEPGGDHRQRATARPGSCLSAVAAGAAVRLLLRVPDGLDRADRQRRSHRAAGRAGRGAAPGVPVLPALHRVGPHVPSGHGGGAAFRRGTAAGRRGGRVQQPALRLEGLSRPRQPRPADHLHRAFAGLGHADQAPADTDRPLAEPAQADGVRHHSGWQRAGPDRPGRRWHLPAHPDLWRGDPDRLRHRLLVLRIAAAGQLPLRPGRARGEPAVGPGRRRIAAGGLRQPGHLLVPGRRPAALLPERHARSRPASGC